MGLFQGNRSTFVKKGLEEITGDHSPYNYFFKDRDGGKLPDNVYRDRISILESSLQDTYDNHAKNKLKHKGLGGIAATALRAGALGSYAVGTGMYLFSPLTGFGFTGAGAGLSTLADAIDTHYYYKSGLIKAASPKTPALAAESATTKFLGAFPVTYFPVGGLIDVYRGRRKFKKAAIKGLAKDEGVLNYAITDFTKKLYKSEPERSGPRVIPLSSFKDQRYSGTPEKNTAIAA